MQNAFSLTVSTVYLRGPCSGSGPWHHWKCTCLGRAWPSTLGTSDHSLPTEYPTSQKKWTRISYQWPSHLNRNPRLASHVAAQVNLTPVVTPQSSMAALWMQSHAFLAHSIPENIDMISCFCDSRSEQNSYPKRSPHRRRTTLAQALTQQVGYMTQIARKAGRLYTVWISIDLLERVVDLSQDSKDQLHFVIPFLFLAARNP